MYASNVAKIAAIILSVATAIVVASCELERPPPEAMVSAVICNGDPYWCVVARSEMDAHRPAFVFIDGEAKGLILPGRTLRVPVKTGETHQVNFCAYFDVSQSKQWKCSTPTDTRFETGNSMLVVFPLD
jgi:hypothetical protein